MKLWLKVIGAVGVLFIASAVAVVVLVTQYDYNKLKPTITQLAKDATGRDLDIHGDLNLAVSLSPTLTVRDVTFANAAWGEQGAMVSLDQLAAKVDLLALLQGRVDVDYLVLDGLKVVLQTDGKGRANWEFETASATAPSAGSEAKGENLTLVPSARDVRLRDVDVTYIDGATSKRVQLLLARADFTADGFAAPMHATLAAAYQGINVDAAIDMGSLSLLVGKTGDAFPLTMKITAPGLVATVDAKVDQPLAGLKVNAQVDLSVSDSTTLAALAGTDLPNLDGLRAGMQITGGGTQYAFNAIDVRVAGSDVGGDVTVHLAGKRPRVVGKLTSKLLDLDKIFGLQTDKPATGAARGPQMATEKPEGAAPLVFSRDPLPLDALRVADVDLNVLAAQIKVSGLSLDAVKAGIKLSNAKLAVKPLSLNVEGGAIDATVHLDGAAKNPALNVNTTLAHLDVGRVLKALNMGDLVSLALNGKVKLSSAGGSMHRLMAGLNGTVRLSARDGTINDATLTELTSGLDSVLPWAKKADGNVIKCMVADWPVKNGVATAETVLLDTPGFSVAVTGNVDLGGERLHLTVVPKAKNTSLASLAVPMRIKGALGAPYVDVDPKDLVVGTVENLFKVPGNLLGDILGGKIGNNGGAQEPDPCFAAMSGGKTTPSAPPTTTPAGPPPQDSTLGKLIPVDEVGKTLKGLFGQ